MQLVLFGAADATGPGANETEEGIPAGATFGRVELHLDGLDDAVRVRRSNGGEHVDDQRGEPSNRHVSTLTRIRAARLGVSCCARPLATRGGADRLPPRCSPPCSPTCTAIWRR